MLNDFKTFTADRLDIHQLVALAAFGRTLRAEYEEFQIDEPTWVDTQLKALRREIHSRNADNLEKRRSEINTRLESLKTPAEKKAALLKELTKLNKDLAEVGAA